MFPPSFSGGVFMKISSLVKEPYTCAVVSLSGDFMGSIDRDKGCLYVGVDRGTSHLLRSGIIPQIMVGDLDSLSRGDLLKLIGHKGIFWLLSNWDKDYTDGQRAIEIAHTVGVKKLVVVGILGREMDHFLGNLALFTMYSHLFEEMIGYTGNQAIVFMKGKRVFHLPVGMPISFVPYDDEVVLTLKGVHWEVERRIFRRNALPPISNIVRREDVYVESDGYIWVIIGREDKPFLLKYLQKEGDSL